MKPGSRISLTIAFGTLAIAILLCAPRDAAAFCGFYVGKADSGLYNQASQVAIVRYEGKTVISMMNDYKGDLKEFALVVPVPVILQKGQIHVGNRELFKRLDAYSAPRMVEYHDPNPCQPMLMMESAPMMAGANRMAAAAPPVGNQKSLGVTVEAQYTVGEYDIVILSAKESDGLETWLITNGYKVPAGASRALKPYIEQNMKFFVAKVNLKEQANSGLSYLRPLQFAFDSPKFMLPIRLGMINAQGPQDLILYLLTKDGRVETTNYRTQKLPTGSEIPEYVRDEFPSFYKAMFEEQTKKEQMASVFTEYFWNMGWCDPCAAEPLSRDELRELGVFWLDDQPQPGPGMGMVMPFRGAVPVMMTRLHVRYTADTFPEDLVFQETQDQENYQARFVIHHSWNGSANECPAAKTYFEQLDQRHQREAETLADLTGWDLKDIAKKTGAKEGVRSAQWWQSLWGGQAGR